MKTGKVEMTTDLKQSFLFHCYYLIQIPHSYSQASREQKSINPPEYTVQFPSVTYHHSTYYGRLVTVPYDEYVQYKQPSVSTRTR